MVSLPLLVVKIGGNVIDSPPLLAQFLTDFAALLNPKVLIHGGGKLATRLAEQLGLPVQMHNGRRITDRDTLDVAVMTYAGLVNKSLVAALQARGCPALGLTGADLDLIRSERRPVKDGIDYGYVGDVRHVHAPALAGLLASGHTPVLAPLTHDGAGQLLNTNADTIAAETAVALAGHLGQVLLLFCFEKKGVLANAQDDSSVIAHIDPAGYAQLKADGVVHSGMIPKLDNAFAAIARGVRAVYIFQAEALVNFGKANFVGTQIAAAR
jgi:acetylglutamate kinase